MLLTCACFDPATCLEQRAVLQQANKRMSCWQILPVHFQFCSDHDKDGGYWVIGCCKLP